MCEALNLNHDVIVKRSHKGLTVEHFHRVFNKSVTIAVEKRSTDDILIPGGIAVGYAWNSASTGGTNIIHSIPAIGRELHFSIDISINALLKLTQNNNQAALDYLKLIDSSSHSFTSIFKILIENCCTTHTERINNNRSILILKRGDIVMVRTFIQSDKKKEKFSKLCYTVRGRY